MTTKKYIREGRVNKSINKLGRGRLLKGSVLVWVERTR